MDNLKHGAQAISEKGKETGAKASYEGNKNVATDSNQDMGTRLNAGVEAVKDKASEMSHASNKETHKQAAMH